MALEEGALAWIYLTSRQCSPDDVPQLERTSFRYRPSLEWWKGAEHDDEGRKVKEGPRFPALVSALRDEHGHVTAVHCTFVARHGIGKAPVDKAKLVFGEVEGAVIRVSKGPTGLTPEEHAADGAEPGVLVVTEGIEDALTLAIDLPDARVWAAFSLGNLMHVPVWRATLLPFCSAMAAPQAADQLERALDHLRLADKPVSVMRAPAPFKDFNDWKRGIA